MFWKRPNSAKEDGTTSCPRTAEDSSESRFRAVSTKVETRDFKIGFEILDLHTGGVLKSDYFCHPCKLWNVRDVIGRSGFSPCVTRAEAGLRCGDSLLMVNGVSVGEHTHNQIKESIRASAAVGELSVVVSRDTLTLGESIKGIERGWRSGVLVRKYSELAERRSDLSRSCALLRENSAKNRYRDVLPYDDSRVKLIGGEYINASWIEMAPRHWVAAQGPTERTAGDFWKCVWETNCRYVLMLTRCVEGHVDKCFQYWPDEPGFIADHGDFEVELQTQNADEFALRRQILLTNITNGKSKAGRENVHPLLYVLRCKICIANY